MAIKKCTRCTLVLCAIAKNGMCFATALGSDTRKSIDTGRTRRRRRCFCIMSLFGPKWMLIGRSLQRTPDSIRGRLVRMGCVSRPGRGSSGLRQDKPIVMKIPAKAFVGSFWLEFVVVLLQTCVDAYKWRCFCRSTACCKSTPQTHETRAFRRIETRILRPRGAMQ